MRIRWKIFTLLFSFGLMAYVQSIAVELGPQGIRANAIAPGVILTPRMEAAFSDEQRAANIAVVPLGRMGVPVDIASAGALQET